MLTLGPIYTACLKCPRHRHFQYSAESSLPPHCDCCRAIYQVLMAHLEHERLQRMAEGMIERAKLVARAGKA